MTLKIGYFADGIWAHRAFELINEDNRFNISFICVRYDSGDLVLENLAATYNIDLVKHPRVSSKDFLNSIDKYNCDLFVSMSFNQIFKKKFIEFPPLGTINCHAGKLPFYRGRNILNWVLINDEDEFGITVHYVDEGIDTGDIILQRSFPISDDDNYSTLLMRAQSGCAEVLFDSLELIYEDKATPIKQNTIHPTGMYCVMRMVGDEIIDWSRTSREIFNLIRGICPPGPGARSELNGREIIINQARMIDTAPTYSLIPGAIIGKTQNSIVVKTGDTSLEIIDYEYEGPVMIGARLK
jgi:methionyl-tRNA formyltransferase